MILYQVIELYCGNFNDLIGVYLHKETAIKKQQEKEYEMSGSRCYEYDVQQVTVDEIKV